MPNELKGASDNNYMSKAINGVASLYRFSSNTFFAFMSVPRAFIDTYKIWKNPEHFILNDLYGRAKKSSISFGDIGLPSSCLPKLVLVAGSRSNVLQVADYGEKNGDTAARALFADVVKMTGIKTIANLQGKEASEQRGKLKPHITGELSLSNAISVTQEVFHRGIQKWEYDKSFQDNITHMIVNILGQTVYSIPSVEMKYIPLLRNASSLLFANDSKSQKFKETIKDMAAMNDDLLARHGQDIFNSENYIKDQVTLDGTETSSEQIKKVLDTRGASGLLVEGNLSGITMVAIAYINLQTEIKDNLLAELQDYQDTHHEIKQRALLDNKTFPYLDSVYKEALRFLSPHAVLARKTSMPTTLKIKDGNGNMSSHVIPRHSVLFSPIRVIHHDPRYWERPECFNPSRFSKNSEANSGYADEHLFPFSIGKRSCPAVSGFAEVVFKSLILESLKYDIKLDQELEDIPVNVMHAHWKKEYFTKEIKFQYTTEVVRNNMRM